MKMDLWRFDVEKQQGGQTRWISNSTTRSTAVYTPITLYNSMDARAHNTILITHTRCLALTADHHRRLCKGRLDIWR